MQNTGNSSLPSTKAVVYQLCVALEKCFLLDAGEIVFIEHYGDVTSDQEQIEVKNYKGNLTAGHENFWKTLHNWMGADFQAEKYSALVLYTTQSIDLNSPLVRWNELSISEKKEILLLINKNHEEKHSQAQRGNGDISKILKYQRGILSDENRDKLHEVLGKFSIAFDSPNLPKLYSQIKEKYLKWTLRNKADDCMDSLLGFITQAKNSDQSQWIITQEIFNEKIRSLNDVYGHGTHIFPRLKDRNFSEDEIKNCKPLLFVKKIEEIAHYNEIEPAIKHYLETQKTIAQELKNYECPQHRLENFSQELRDSFDNNYRIACQRCTQDVIPDSQSFYNDRILEPSPTLEGYQTTPINFKNGMLHMQMDEEDLSMQWKLKGNNG